MTKTQALRRLLQDEGFIYMPVAYDALGSRLVQDTGFKAVYNGGYVTGGTRCASAPLLTMAEQGGGASPAPSPTRSRSRRSPTAGRDSASRCTRCERCASSSARASPASTS